MTSIPNVENNEEPLAIQPRQQRNRHYDYVAVLNDLIEADIKPIEDEDFPPEINPASLQSIYSETHANLAPPNFKTAGTCANPSRNGGL